MLHITLQAPAVIQRAGQTAQKRPFVKRYYRSERTWIISKYESDNEDTWMAWYWWALIAGVAVYLYSKKRSGAGEMDSKDVSLLNPWFRSEGIEPSSVTYSTYTDVNIMGDGAEKIYVGMGYREGKNVGFWAEMAGAKVIDANTIQPGAASYHREDARVAGYEGGLLKHKLTERSLKITMNM
jgi:hypothetical protein